MRLATLQSRNEFILYDAGILWDGEGAPQIEPDPAWFTAAFWQARDAVVGQAPGRGASLFVDASSLVPHGPHWVLRGYRRGGFVARLSDSRYVWLGLERTRAFRELRLTALLHEQGLPVPRPIAGLARRHGPTYEGALLTVRLPGARTLAERLPDADAALLERVGMTIRRFHRAGLDHVDLNARNLLVTPDERIWLIDLDRCRLRKGGRWQQANLQRLERSLTRFVPDNAATCWQPLWHGYHQS